MKTVLLLLLALALLIAAWYNQRPVHPAWRAPELTVQERAWYKSTHKEKGTGGSVIDHQTGERYFYDFKGRKVKL